MMDRLPLMCESVCVCVWEYTFTMSTFMQKFSVKHDTLKPVCTFRANQLVLITYENHGNLPKLFSHVKTIADRDVIAVEIVPRGSKNRPWADYFQSKQTGFWGVCWSRAGRWAAGFEGSWKHSSASVEVFLRIKAMKLDSGKAVLTSFVWSAAAVILGCFLAWRQRVLEDVTLTLPSRQTGTSRKSYTSWIKNLNIFFIKEDLSTLW